MRRTRFPVPVLLALIVALAAGCGAATPAGNPSSASGVEHFGVYKNAEYLFSIAYPAAWTKTIKASASASPATGDLLLTAAFVDLKGGLAKSGKPVDGDIVEVFQLDKAVRPGTRYTNTAMRITGGSLLPRLNRVQLAGKPKEVTVHGDPGWSVAYRYSLQGHTMQALSVLVLKHRYAYWLTGQATAETWSGVWPRLRISLGTFRVR
jgi:hypothetical protein